MTDDASLKVAIQDAPPKVVIEDADAPPKVVVEDAPPKVVIPPPQEISSGEETKDVDVKEEAKENGNLILRK